MYALEGSVIVLGPKDQTMKILVQKAANQLTSISKSIEGYCSEMNQLASQLPEYPLVRSFSYLAATPKNRAATLRISRRRKRISNTCGTDGFLDKSKQYTDITELILELLRLFIEKIVVHEKEMKWSKHAPQTVEIYYNGIGCVAADAEQETDIQESA